MKGLIVSEMVMELLPEQHKQKKIQRQKMQPAGIRETWIQTLKDLI